MFAICCRCGDGFPSSWACSSIAGSPKRRPRSSIAPWSRGRSSKNGQTSGVGTLDRKRLAIVREVYAWREEKAARLNRPSRVVLGRPDYRDCARNPNVEADLTALRTRQSRFHGDRSGGQGSASTAGRRMAGGDRARQRSAAGQPGVEPARRGGSRLLHPQEADLRHCRHDFGRQMAGARWYRGDPLPAESHLTHGWRKDHVVPEMLAILEGRRGWHIGDLHNDAVLDYFDEPQVWDENRDQIAQRTQGGVQCPRNSRERSGACTGDLADLRQGEFDYRRLYANADLHKDYWSVVGPADRHEFAKLGSVKLKYLIDLGLTPDSRVLDAGCGTGLLATTLAGYLHDNGCYVGSDIAAEAIQFCRADASAGQNFGFIRQEMTEIPLHDVAFDAIVFYSVFTHTFPDETILLLAEARRLLASGGFRRVSFLKPACRNSPMATRPSCCAVSPTNVHSPL